MWSYFWIGGAGGGVRQDSNEKKNSLVSSYWYMFFNKTYAFCVWKYHGLNKYKIPVILLEFYMISSNCIACVTVNN